MSDYILSTLCPGVFNRQPPRVGGAFSTDVVQVRFCASIPTGQGRRGALVWLTNHGLEGFYIMSQMKGVALLITTYNPRNYNYVSRPPGTYVLSGATVSTSVGYRSYWAAFAFDSAANPDLYFSGFEPDVSTFSLQRMISGMVTVEQNQTAELAYVTPSATGTTATYTTGTNFTLSCVAIDDMAQMWTLDRAMLGVRSAQSKHCETFIPGNIGIVSVVGNEFSVKFTPPFSRVAAPLSVGDYAGINLTDSRYFVDPAQTPGSYIWGGYLSGAVGIGAGVGNDLVYLVSTDTTVANITGGIGNKTTYINDLNFAWYDQPSYEIFLTGIASYFNYQYQPGFFVVVVDAYAYLGTNGNVSTEYITSCYWWGTGLVQGMATSGSYSYTNNNFPQGSNSNQGSGWFRRVLHVPRPVSFFGSSKTFFRQYAGSIFCPYQYSGIINAGGNNFTWLSGSLRVNPIYTDTRFCGRGPARVFTWEDGADARGNTEVKGQNIHINGLFNVEVGGSGSNKFMSDKRSSAPVNANLVPVVNNLYLGSSPMFKKVWRKDEYCRMVEKAREGADKFMRGLFSQ